MPVKKTVSASDFSEQSPIGPDMLRQRGSSFALTLPAMEKGKSMTFIIKGPADRDALTKALDRGEMSDAWSVSVKDSKTGKTYAINAETLFAYRERRQAEGRESATVRKYVATVPASKKEAPKARLAEEMSPARDRDSRLENIAREPAGVSMPTALSGRLKETQQSSGATVLSGRRTEDYVALSGRLHETEQSPGAFSVSGKKKKGQGT